MLWVIVFVGIAVAGLVMVVCYAVWLAHKTADVLSEVTELGARGAQLAELLGQIQAPDTGWERNETHDLITGEASRDRQDIDVR